MATKKSEYRLGPATLDQLNALAASAGSQAQAIRECAHHWYHEVAAAAAANWAELSEEDWHRLALLNDPSDPVAELTDDGPRVVDWSGRLAAELVGMWVGRSLVLPAHKLEAKACGKLAARIAEWGPARGYALMAAIRYFWRHPDAGTASFSPDVWLVPESRAGEGG